MDMFSIYQPNATDDSITKKIALYMDALRDIPAAKVEGAIRSWIAGTSGHREAGRWAANPAVLRQITMEIRDKPNAELITLGQLLRAKVVAPVAMTDAEREERKRHVDKMLKHFSGEDVIEPSRKAVDL